MRHKKRNVKLGRSPQHRKALLASLVCNFIEERRIQTTLAKAKQARSLAEKMVTLGKAGTLAARRQAIATLRRKEYVAKLFSEIVPLFADRHGGYTRIVKLGFRRSDGAPLALLEWVNVAAVSKKKKKPEGDKKDEKKDAKPEEKKEEKKDEKK